jgi:hypothetical protein
LIAIDALPKGSLDAGLFLLGGSPKSSLDYLLEGADEGTEC